MTSEIKDLVTRIDNDAIAMYRGLSGLASTARHDFIASKYASIDQSRIRLVELIGNEEEANTLVAKLLDTTLTMCLEHETKGGK